MGKKSKQFHVQRSRHRSRSGSRARLCPLPSEDLRAGSWWGGGRIQPLLSAKPSASRCWGGKPSRKSSVISRVMHFIDSSWRILLYPLPLKK